MFNIFRKKKSPIKKEILELIKKIRDNKLTYLTDSKLYSIVKTCQDIEEKGLSGIFLEAGCALGGSAILIASQKSSHRPLFLYDVFGTIPPPTKDDPQEVHERYHAIITGQSKGINGDTYYGYIDNLYEIVKLNLVKFDIDCEKEYVQLIKGLLQETMQIDQPVAFAHIDVDWYEPVKVSLERIFPKLVLGGSIILDDYFDWGGCKKATDEYLEKIDNQFIFDTSAQSAKITRKSN